jgi:hypothetical protein
MVDVNDGRMLAIQPIADAIAPLLAEGDLIDRISVLSGEAVVLPDGRIRLWAGVSARLNNGNKKSVGTWIVWTQGEHPRLLPAPSWPGPLRGEVRYSMTPDGTKVLATFPLGPPMVCIEPSSGCRVTGPPVEGPLIVAYDLSTGAVVWTFRAWAAAPDNRRAAAIHPEGRIALVQLAVFWAVGVLDMATGELLQALPGGPELTYGFFGQSGRCAFVQFPDRLQVYQVETTASNVPSRCGPPGSTH